MSILAHVKMSMFPQNVSICLSWFLSVYSLSVCLYCLCLSLYLSPAQIADIEPMLLNIVEKGGSEDSGNATSMMTNDEKYEPIVELVIEDRDELQEKLQEQVTMQTKQLCLTPETLISILPCVALS